jgi:uncharacterized damage-inducible protein DinB
MRLIAKPAPDEYPAYAEMYIKLLPGDGLILDHLAKNFESAKSLVLSLPAEKLLYRYAENKWTIKEILVHLIDDERIYAYRAVCFARGEKAHLPGFNQDEYTLNSGANERDINSILEEYEAVRRSTIALFNGLPETAFSKTGIADGKKDSVRALLYHLAGHELHHLNLVKERYL